MLTNIKTFPGGEVVTTNFKKRGVFAVKATLQKVVAITLMMAVLLGGGVTAFAATTTASKPAIAEVQFGVGNNYARVIRTDGTTEDAVVNAETYGNARYIMEVPPEVYGDTTMIPFRALGNSIGASVDYKRDETVPRVIMTFRLGTTASAETITVTGWVGNYTLDVVSSKSGKRQVSMPLPPTVINGRTMVPMRAIAEALGATVKFHGESGDRAATIRIILGAYSSGSSSAYIASYSVDGNYLDIKNNDNRVATFVKDRKDDWYKAKINTNSSDDPAYGGFVVPTDLDLRVWSGSNITCYPSSGLEKNIARDDAGKSMDRIVSGTKVTTYYGPIQFIAWPGFTAESESYDISWEGYLYFPRVYTSSIWSPEPVPTPYPTPPNINVGVDNANAAPADFYLTWDDGIRHTYTADAYAYNSRYFYKLQHVAIAMNFSVRYEWGQWVIDTDTPSVVKTITLNRNRPNGQAKAAPPLIRVVNGENKGQIYGVEAILGPDGEIYVDVVQMTAEIYQY